MRNGIRSITVNEDIESKVPVTGVTIGKREYVSFDDIVGIGYWVLIVVSIAMIIWGLRYKVGRRTKNTRIRYAKGISNMANYNNEEDDE